MTTVLPCDVSDSNVVAVFGGKVWLRAGGYDTTESPFMFNSPDLMSWSLYSTWGEVNSLNFKSTDYTPKVIGGKLLFADANFVDYTTDGLSWTSASVVHGTINKYVANRYAVKEGVSWGITKRSGQIFLVSSTDGITYSSVATNLPYSYSENAVPVVLGGTRYLLPQGSGQIYTSADGVIWSAVTSNFPVLYSYGHVVDGSRIYVMGGLNAVYVAQNRVFSTSDMTNWTEEHYSTIWPARLSLAALSFGGDMAVLGGLSSAYEYLRDVWKLSNGSAVPSSKL